MSVPFPALEHAIVQAPLAGGPSTPELAAAVSSAGGLGFLAAGYLTAEAVADQIVRLRELTSAPYGLNIFCLEERTVDAAALEPTPTVSNPRHGRSASSSGSRDSRTTASRPRSRWRRVNARTSSRSRSAARALR